MKVVMMMRVRVRMMVGLNGCGTCPPDPPKAK
jgi:hypothetical protein